MFLLVYSDKDGYEGDDLNSVVPAIHLNEMRAGLIEGYKYDWQPLSYHLSSIAFKVTSLPESMFIIAPISIAISILFLFIIVRRSYGTKPLSFVCLLLMFPEVIYTGLYYNSHAPACLLYILALFYLLKPNVKNPDRYKSVVIGALASLAILFRFDYILAMPIVVVLFYLRFGSLKNTIVLVFTSGLILILGTFLGVFSFLGLLEIYQTSSQEIADKASVGGWDGYTKMMALTVMLSPVGWFFFLTTTVWFIAKRKEKNCWRMLLIFLSILPMLYPLKDLLSVKYALPLLTWVFIFGAYLFKLIEERAVSVYNKLQPFYLVTGLFLLVVNINVDNAKPYFNLSFTPQRVITTHDGMRSWGGYLQQFIKIKSSNHNSEGYIQANAFLRDINANKNTTLVILGKQNVFESSSTGWRYMQLMLSGQPGFSSKVVGPKHIRIQIATNTVHLCESLECIDNTELAGSNTRVVYPDHVNF